MVSIDNVTVSFGGWDLFNEISFIINPRDRIGLVGRNGAGKTTLLKVITGEQPTNGGAVGFGLDVELGYLPQQMKVADTTTLFIETEKAFERVLSLEREIAEITHEIGVRTDYESEEYEQLLIRLNTATEQFNILGGYHREAEIEKILIGLGFSRNDFDRPTSEFSGGWRMRIELAKLLLRRPTTLLLDEPTNHLDIESIGWFEEYLKDFNGSVVLISHDRLFLDNITTRTIEISLGKIYDYSTNYTHYLELRRERREQQMAAYTNQQRMIEKTEDFIERFRYKASKANQVQSRVKQLEKLDVIEIDEEDVKDLNIKFPPSPRSGDIVVEAKDAGKSFGKHHVFSGADFVIERGEKIALVGRNGEGKTTFARMIVGEIEPTEGSVRTGYNVEVGYYAQNQENLLDGEATVFETLDRVAVGDIRTRLREILAAFLFRGGDIDKRVKVLSGGERARLALAQMMLKPHNLLIMDEPTNHMDMRSKDILKSALARYDGALVLISHDREFLDGLAEKVYEFRDGGVNEYLGGIHYFLERRKMESMRDIERREQATKKEKEETKESQQTTRQSYKERKEQERVSRKVSSQIKKTEQNIVQLEKQVAEWEIRMAKPEEHGIDLADPQVFEEYNRLKRKLELEMHQWEKSHYELELLTGGLEE